MTIPVNPADVRMISIDEGKLHLVLAAGYVELQFKDRNELMKALKGINLRSSAVTREHVMFDDGILGL